MSVQQSMPTTTQPTTTQPTTTPSYSHQSSSLYVGDLHPEVTEALLYETFNSIGPVTSVRVCRDSSTRRSLGYGYVNFTYPQDAERALDVLNFTMVKGFPCRVMWSQRDPSFRKNNESNVFVKNLPDNIDSKALNDMFSEFGSILSCKVSLNNEMKSKGFGFVQFSTVESAAAAIEKKNGAQLEDKILTVTKFEKRADRTGGRFTNIYVKDVPQNWTREDLEKHFSKFGKITSTHFPEKDEGYKGFGCLNFEKHEDAMRAIAEGKKIGEKEIYVDRFQKRSEREVFLRRRTNNFHREIAQQSKFLNLYVKNLEDDVDNAKLNELFSKFGSITSAVVMRDANGNSRGFGFVCFKAKEEAERALTSMNSTVVGKRRLFVSYAQRREERRAFLDSHFQASMHLNQRMQFSQLYYPPIMTPMFPQPPLMPRAQFQGRNPYQAQYQQRNNYMRGVQQFPNQGNRGGISQGRPQKPRTNQPRFQQQFVPPVTSAPIVSQGHGSSLTSVLASETPEAQKNILGEKLFPLIQKDHPDLAGKITGMLLEMEVSEILSLLESPQDRDAKIREALDVLGVRQ